MPCNLEDVEALGMLVKQLVTERRKMAKLSEKARLAPLGKASQRASAELHFQAAHVETIERNVHAAAVDCGIADLRDDDFYRDYEINPSGWHCMKVVPRKPRAVSNKSL